MLYPWPMSFESPAVSVRRQLALIRALVDELERQLSRNESHDALRIQLADELRALGEGLQPRPLRHAAASCDLAALTAPTPLGASSVQPCA